MAKILLIILAFIILIFVVMVLFSAIIVADRSDKHDNNIYNNEGYDDLFFKQ